MRGIPRAVWCAISYNRNDTRERQMTIVRMLFIWLGFLTLSTFSEPDYRSTSAYLDHLAKGITEDQSAMVNAETWRRG